MAEKLRSWRVLSCALAVLATIVFIFACSEPELVDIGSNDIGLEIEYANTNFFSGNHMKDIIDSLKTLPSSSSEGPSSSSSEEKGNKDSSSSEGGASTQSSSSAAKNSSSSEAQKSSSSNPYTLTCSVTQSTIDPKPTGYSASEVANIVKIECKYGSTKKDINAKDDVIWTNAPDWNSTVAGTFSNVKIKVYNDVDVCTNMDATCGNITVRGNTTPSSSSRAATTSSASNNNTPSSSSRADTTPSSSSRANTASSSSAASSGGGCTAENNTKYCYYGSASNCYKMPTDDCCKDGTLVDNCNSVSAEYCDYGVCKGGSGWDCKDGGGCYLKKAGDTCNGGSTVKSCPKDHLPPSAQ